ncbi:hypothetical protein PtA15_11A59 [Puccinia triticina]|uniref:Uncharacterized protein n=1 Tax=Puccinia triticina TaxID=208348 RepID=A0ABY7CZE4_9BASI|nr:uncharacterized protein PtA15_11A59 [Puccinia triticina]WAQ89372.1 hypothetical protein PtA15_11A59 [Puccinia triticina]WAR59421.1 hypothetical protein PtB15_11B61 [Puccinia triticina]
MSNPTAKINQTLNPSPNPITTDDTSPNPSSKAPAAQSAQAPIKTNPPRAAKNSAPKTMS